VSGEILKHSYSDWSDHLSQNDLFLFKLTKDGKNQKNMLELQFGDPTVKYPEYDSIDFFRPKAFGLTKDCLWASVKFPAFSKGVTKTGSPGIKK